jgi:signal peptidase I
VQNAMTRSSTPARPASWKILICILLCSAISAVLLHRYVIAVYIIRGSSMSPTLNDGDTAVVNMLIRRMGQLQRGEIVLVQDGFKEFATKRVVGLPGERIDIAHGRVYVNGRLLPENYLKRDTRTGSRRTTFKLGSDDYFVLGDNRSDSYDSRSYGPVPRAAIMGSYSRTFWAYR